MPKQTTTQRN